MEKEKKAVRKKRTIKKKQPVVEKPKAGSTYKDIIGSSIKMAQRITVYGWSVGHRGFRYGLIVPAHSKAVFRKEMSGLEAHQMLYSIKRKNKLGRLESRVLLEVSDT